MTIVPFRVLVAEDNYLIAAEVAEALQGAGATIVGPLPSLGQLKRSAHSCAVDAAVLDIRLGKELVFPAADILVQSSVPLVFFSGYDDIVIPERFTASIRVSKSTGLEGLVAAVFDQRFAVAAASDLAGEFAFGIVDLLPELRWIARRLEGDRDAADGLVELTLEAALASLERGSWSDTPRAYLRRLLAKIHEQRARKLH